MMPTPRRSRSPSPRVANTVQRLLFRNRQAASARNSESAVLGPNQRPVAQKTPSWCAPAHPTPSQAWNGAILRLPAAAWDGNRCEPVPVHTPYTLLTARRLPTNGDDDRDLGGRDADRRRPDGGGRARARRSRRYRRAGRGPAAACRPVGRPARPSGPRDRGGYARPGTTLRRRIGGATGSGILAIALRFALPGCGDATMIADESR